MKRKGLKIRFLSFIPVLFVLLSCNDKYEAFYHDNRKALNELVKKLQYDTLANGCCIEDSCLKKDVKDLMEALHIECVSKDTVQKTLIFSLHNRHYLMKVAYIYQYGDVDKDITEFDRAGEKAERISQRWYIRKNFFD